MSRWLGIFIAAAVVISILLVLFFPERPEVSGGRHTDVLNADPPLKVDEGERILIEAENAVEIVPAVRLAPDPRASMGRCIEIVEGAGKPSSGSKKKTLGYARYVFEVKKPGIYHLWGRKFWRDGCGNSFTIKMDEMPDMTFGGDGTYERWTWIRLNIPNGFELEPGEHVLLVKNREDGVKLDQILLTNVHPDEGGVPQGIEEP
jgi:hypothetical protein